MLFSIRKISALEQIGYNYGNEYGYEKSSWKSEPCIFNEFGEVISREHYEIPNIGVMFDDLIIDTKYCLVPVSRTEFGSFLTGMHIPIQIDQ
ncbi:hypothetical protein GAMM_100042 [Gammaproteobacteria bacterium]